MKEENEKNNSIFMMLIISVALFGCNNEEKNNQQINPSEEENNQQIKPSEEEPKLVKVDKTTDKDVENVCGAINNSKELRYFENMDGKIRGVQLGSYSFYLTEIDDEQYEILCAYINESEYQKYERFRDYGYYSKATWYKCSDKDSIKENIDGLRLTGIVAVYDAVIIKDIVDDKEYNYKCKYYKKIDENITEENISSDNFKPKYKELIIYVSKDSIKTNNYYFSRYVLDLGYEIRTNTEGVKRVVFDEIISHYNNYEIISFKDDCLCVRGYNQKSYECFSEWLTDEEEYEKIDYSTKDSEMYEILKKVSINLDTFIKLIREINLEE